MQATDPASTNTIKKDARSILQAGIAAADPYKAVKRCLIVNEDHIEILLNLDNPEQKRLGRWSNVHLIAFGKAACAMARAASEIIPAHLLADNSIAVTNYENECVIDNIEVIGAGHPLPDQAGLKAAKKCADIARRAQKDELVLVLISGGGSALLPYPADRITLQEKIAATDLLLASGANINQINCVRKHVSRIKGGGLAGIAQPAALHALVLSDVLGNDVSAIASGPTVPDTTTYADAVEILKSRGVWDRVAANVQDYLEQGKRGSVPETPKPGDEAFKNSSYTLIGSNALSVKAVMKAARKHGYEARLYSDKLGGEAREEAEKLVIYAKAQIEKGLLKPVAFLAGGETTVTLKGKGLGGRNQEFALAFACAAQKHGLTGNWTFLSGGTDGRDGPTDAAGGMVDRGTLHRITEAGVNPAVALENNDSYTALKSSQDLLFTGPTGTNVADLQILLIHPDF
ncbi:Glycerate 2-kinase [Candidatus Methylobacter favarea]|uniref:Glycerate 2-kinase n=1 Tax=Candidatus Methylobacter favarea TaxID=2707345 RepID=A0A8S0X239_9GAMM|nr:glycerate kinase [Candidatus Methylobacter favarea]CAA9891602.1 Glycerate 2-kinase [Candidatus Methylobacter favarea]